MRAIGVVSLLLFLIRQSLTTLAQSKPIPVGLKIESEGGGQRFGNVGTGRNGLDAQRSQDAQNTAAGGHREAGRDQGRPARYPEHMPELKLALNTGLRLSEMYGLTWENVNVSRRVLTIPRSKNGETHHVPLNATAVTVLLELLKRGDAPGE
jgi:Phage integrase family